jgi:secreted PhoX family phosphatase
MARDFERMEDSNRSANRSIHEISDPSRRVVLLGGIGALTLGALAPWLAGRAVAAPAAGGRPLIGFKSVPVSEQDAVVVPEGYEAVAFAAWGEPIGVPGNIPAFRWVRATAPPTRRCRSACITTASTTFPSTAAVRTAYS